MKLDQLSYFAAAARLESVGKAARQVAISPSAVSHAIAALEGELGIRLFAREKKRIRLTDSGRLLLERAERILGDVSRLRAELGAEHVGLEGRFALAATQSLAVRFVTAAWSGLQARHPGLGASLHVLGSRQIAAKVSGSELDLGFCFGPIAHPDVRSRVLATERFSVVTRKRHPVLRLGPRARAAELARTACAAPRLLDPETGFEHPELERLGIRQRVDFVFETYDVAVQRVLHSGSWALLPDAYLRAHRSELARVELPAWDARADILAVWPADRPLGRALSQLCSEVAKRCLTPFG